MEPNGLKVLMISSDRKILEQGSAVSKRMIEYGALVDELHIVLLSTRGHKLKDTSLSSKVFVYPTHSSFKFRYPGDAARIGKQIVFDKQFVRGKSLITAQDPFECGLAGLKIKSKWRIPLELQLHTDPFSPYFKGFLNTIRKRIARKTLKQADMVRVVSQSLGEEIKKIFKKKESDIKVLPIYIDQKRIEGGQVTFDLHARFGWHFIMLCVARLTEEKNLGLALEVLKRVKTFFPDAGLVIVGSGPEEDRLHALAKSLGVEKSVAFVGWQEDIASYYKTANIFLQTSRFEGYGLALVEAGLLGLPIVSTPVGVANDFENGKDLLVCPHDDPEYMFKAVYDLLANNQVRELMRTHMKHSLETKLISQDEYLSQLLANWKETASRVHL
jgi:glycosyltransferase involved in cell wall biosynthesis